jgi:hypothetical protein
VSGRYRIICGVTILYVRKETKKWSGRAVKYRELQKSNMEWDRY